MGYQIIAISTDSPENLTKSIGKHQLVILYYQTATSAYPNNLGLLLKHQLPMRKRLQKGSGGRNIDNLLPVPSVFILDQKGIIQFEYINPDFKQRISPSLLQSVASVLKKENSAKN